MPSNATILAVCLKAAREAAEEVARRIASRAIDEVYAVKPKDGYTPVKGVDYDDGKDGYTPIKGVDYYDGKDGVTPIKGRDYDDGQPGRDGATWFLIYGEPDNALGRGGDFALDGDNSDIYHKSGNEWEFVVHLKAETPQMMMQAPRAYSDEKIREIVTVAIQAADSYHVIDEDSDNAVKYYGFGKDDDQGHYIERVDTSVSPIAYRVAVPVADYATDWTNRASLTYVRRTEVDIP